MRRMLLHPTSELPDDTLVEQIRLPWHIRQQRRANNRRQRAEGSNRNAAKVKNGARWWITSAQRSAEWEVSPRGSARPQSWLKRQLTTRLGMSAILTGKR